MAIKPILFNTEMVRAILDGRKAQTRRVAFKHDDLREFKSVAYPDGWWYMGRVFNSFDDFLRYARARGNSSKVMTRWRKITLDLTALMPSRRRRKRKSGWNV